MNARFFVDTNVFVYTVDRRDPVKHRRARAALEEITGEIFLSTQVLQECYVSLVKKVEMRPQDAQRFVRSLRQFDVVSVSPDLVEDAIEISITKKLSFWDSLLLSTAISARCSVLLTEDLNHGQVIRGVRIENPFLWVRP